jgi:hypothetical protein
MAKAKSNAENKKSANANEGRISIIIGGISRLFEVNKNLGWFLIIVSILSSIQTFAYRSDYNQAQGDLSATYNIGSAELAWFAVFFSIFLIPFMLVGAAVFVFIHGMVSYAALQSMKGKNTTIKECFDATKKRFWVLLGASIIAFFKIVGGLLLFIIPGIRAASRYFVISFVVFDKNLSASESVNYTKEITKGRLLALFLALVASTIISPLAYLIQYGSMVGLYPWLEKMSKEQSA